MKNYKQITEDFSSIRESVEEILEAMGKPSGIKKYKDFVRKETVHFKSGDVYDLSDPGYDEEFKYYDGSGNGYIKDKEGHVYDVVTWERQGDAGRIAGGSTKFGVIIKKANGKDDFSVSGYIAVFSNGSNVGCVADIEDGYYLEDYIAKYYNSYSHGDKFKELAEKGDKNAKSFAKGKAEKKAQRVADFKERYIPIPKTIYWEVDSNGFNILRWSPSDNKEGEEYNDLAKQRSNTSFWAKDENGRESNEKNPVWQELDKKMQDIKSKLDAQYLSVFKPILENTIKEIFKTSNVNTLSGIGGTFNVKSKNSWDSNSQYAIDTKNNKIVSIDVEKSKVTKEDLSYTVGDIISINKKDVSPEMEKLFKAVSKAWMKINGKKQTEYIEKNWRRIQNASSPYWNRQISNSDAKSNAKYEYKKMVAAHDWDKNDKLQFSLSLIKDYVEGDLPDSEGPVNKPLSNPEPENIAKQRGKDTKMSKGAEKVAYDKMTAWHEGKRKQNLANCSDAKLKMNYKVCKELGYEKEMELLKKEAESRGIDINESLSLIEFMKKI